MSHVRQLGPSSGMAGDPIDGIALAEETSEILVDSPLTVPAQSVVRATQKYHSTIGLNVRPPSPDRAQSTDLAGLRAARLFSWWERARLSSSPSPLSCNPHCASGCIPRRSHLCSKPFRGFDRPLPLRPNQTETELSRMRVDGSRRRAY
ncbi:hypothetical protein T484DRAFT_3142032 [Baffinella frigidus]|nr:hypothetical protein T484DRAFT_3142032 [Cryptophyta sp. CCMP2293]